MARASIGLEVEGQKELAPLGTYSVSSLPSTRSPLSSRSDAHKALLKLLETVGPEANLTLQDLLPYAKFPKVVQPKVVAPKVVAPETSGKAAKPAELREDPKVVEPQTSGEVAESPASHEDPKVVEAAIDRNASRSLVPAKSLTPGQDEAVKAMVMIPPPRKIKEKVASAKARPSTKAAVRVRTVEEEIEEVGAGIKNAADDETRARFQDPEFVNKVYQVLAHRMETNNRILFDQLGMTAPQNSEGASRLHRILGSHSSYCLTDKGGELIEKLVSG